MPLKNFIDKNQKTIFVKAKDLIPVGMFFDWFDEMFARPDFEQGYKIFGDYSEAHPDVALAVDQIIGMVRFVTQIQDKWGYAKWGFYAPEEDVFVFFKIFEKMMAPLKVDVKVFKDKDQALQWLGITEREVGS